MQQEEIDYINQLIAGDVGMVWADASKPFLTGLEELLTFIEDNLHYENAIINAEHLTAHWERFNEDVLKKRRVFYLSQVDFNSLDTGLMSDDTGPYIPYKTINETTVLPDDFVKPNECYFCTDEEFQILKAAKS